MAVLNRLTATEIAHYTHFGWFCFLVPVYIADIESDCPTLCARNGVPEWWFDVVGFLFDGFAALAEAFRPGRAPCYPLLISGTIELEADHGAP
jgi:hypothetical protein